MADHKHIVEVTNENFKQEVLDASDIRPVLVDFWADWCQPCHHLTPILEQLAFELADKVKIVKVNSDEQQSLAVEFNVRNLPTVKLFQNGKVVNEFTGLIPLDTIKQFLDPYLPRASDGLIQQAMEALDRDESERALTILREAWQADPENYRIHPKLAGLMINNGFYEEAAELINSLPANIQQNQEYAVLMAILRFTRTASEAPDLEAVMKKLEQDPAAPDYLYQLGAYNVLAGKYEQAMECLLKIVRVDRKFKDDGGRKALVDVFTILNNEGPLVKKYRGLLSSALN